MSGPDLSQRLRAQPAGRRATGALATPSWLPDPIAGWPAADRGCVSPCGGLLRPVQRDSGDQAEGRRPQHRPDAPHLERAAATGRSQVAAIGVAQEFQWVFVACRRDTDPTKVPQFGFDQVDRRVTVYYFYLWDDGFGPAFIKICAYFPYPIKVWANGHEWAKRQAAKAGIGYTALSNGFATCDNPAGLQAICDRLGPGTLTVFFERWMARLPLPLTAADRDGGYWWELSMRQIEVSRTIVFTQPR